MAEREAMVVTHERTATALDRIADALDTLVRPGLPTKKPERRSGLDRNGPAETRDVTQADIQGQQLADGRASGLDCRTFRRDRKASQVSTMPSCALAPLW